PSSPQDLRLCSAHSCPNRTPMSVSASVTWAAFHVGTVIVVSLGTFNQYCWVVGADMGSSCVAWQSAPLR
ncbi:MAG: hypothetical protein JRN07_04345, partial [Nitrososphaerota archaeon]|nr:hypothetical protein [Nitrososphaerota archaeon]